MNMAMKIIKSNKLKKANVAIDKIDTKQEIWEFKDRRTIAPGEYYGIGKTMYKFTSKKKREYVKLVVGVRQNYKDGVEYIEVDKVLPAEFYCGAELYKILEELDLVENNVACPEKFTNMKLKIYVEYSDEKYVEKYPLCIKSIEIAEEMPEESDFLFEVKRFNGLLPEFNPTLCEKKSDIRNEKTGSHNCDDNDEDDFSDC